MQTKLPDQIKPDKTFDVVILSETEEEDNLLFDLAIEGSRRIAIPNYKNGLVIHFVPRNK